jgi:hypothetical protein
MFLVGGKDIGIMLSCLFFCTPDNSLGKLFHSIAFSFYVCWPDHKAIIELMWVEPLPFTREELLF